MTRKRAKEILPIIQAWAEGKSIQMRGGVEPDRWRDVSCEEYFVPEDNWDYRIKPDSKLRPWKPEEVPLNAVFRHGNNGYPTQWVDMSEQGLRLAIMGRTDAVYVWQQLKDEWTHTIDGGKIWQPCGVNELES